MALKAVLASLDGLAEALQGEYTKNEQDGRFYLNVEGVDEMPAVKGLKAKNGELLDEKKAVQAKLEAFGDFTPEKIAEMKEAAGKDSSKRVQELEDKLAKASEAAQREIATAKEAAEKERGAARGYFKSAEIARAASALKGDPELLEPFIGKHVDVIEQDGRFALKVLGPDGQARIKDSGGNAFTIDDLVGEFKANPKYGGFFAADGKTGSGANPNSNGGGGGNGSTVRVENGVIRADPAKVASGEITVTA